MSRFNLLEENWIRVLEEGEMKEVSLITLFENAEKYRCLAGEMATQDFAMLRFLLAVLHTVFSRVNADGEAYEFLEIDEKFRQKEAVSEDDEEEYNDALMETWKTLWQRGKFPSVVRKYLEAWKEHFYLLDEKYPFYQVTKEEALPRLQNNKNTGFVTGSQINRTISESKNKMALFSPKGEEYKSKMQEGELSRWLIMLQGYFGNTDKVKFCKEQSYSLGWLYGLGGIYLTGKNVFETLMMNFKITVDPVGNRIPKQMPCWEFSGEENIEKAFLGVEDNLAGLYTNWGRAIIIDSKMKFSKDINIGVVKMPKLEVGALDIEPMTLWKKIRVESKGFDFIPKIHIPGQALWRSYGLITIPDGAINDVREPGVISWYGKTRQYWKNSHIGVIAVGLKDDGQPMSKLPINEIFDELFLHEIVLFEKGAEGWVIRIKEVVEETKKVVDSLYTNFLKEVSKIRHSNTFVRENIDKVYYVIDKSFRDWLSGINESSSKEEKIKQWKENLIRIVEAQANELLSEDRKRDIRGNKSLKTKGIKNIFTVYESFHLKLMKFMCTK